MPGAARGHEPAPARACAYAILRRVFERGAYADRALQSEAKALLPRDRALATRLAYGAIQRRATLDHLIGELAGRPAEALDAPLLAALRLGMHELCYLDGAPAYATVADAVELAKANARAGAGLVNAVLRRALREDARARLAALPEDTPERAALKHSHPEWVARMWWQTLGPEQARALMAWDNQPAEVALRANTLVSDADALARGLGVASHRDAELPEAIVLEQPLDLHATEAWRRGEMLAQSRGAMLVARALAPAPGERVLDLCAAPGGKSTHLAALMEGEGEVVAVERDARRAAELELTARRLQARIVRVEVADAARPRSDGPFDRVLVDPPCSGLGTLQARADLRWRVNEQSAAEMARSQTAILAAGAGAVRPGGVLVYSTCTICPLENEQVIAAFLESTPEFSVGEVRQTLPHRDRTAGFFIARLTRD
jgi:16S rRNA (cytosine967-C5)-methyltransferase